MSSELFSKLNVPVSVAQTKLFSGPAQRKSSLTVVGARDVRTLDLYHWLLPASWILFVVLVGVVFLVLNAIFGSAYWAVGGIYNAHTWTEHFFFSVHTLGTIGYGSMYPTTTTSEWVMTLEAIVGVLFSAVVTGLAFAKFARPTARVSWSKVAVVCDRDGIPTLMFRVANERMNHVVDSSMRCALMRSDVTLEGEHLRRILDMPLVRSTTPSFVLSWTALHQIVPGSPLYGMTPEQVRTSDVEIALTLTGLDETLMQTINARHSYIGQEIMYGARLSDVVGGRDEKGRRIIDYRKFHDFEPAPLSVEKLGISLKLA